MDTAQNLKLFASGFVGVIAPVGGFAVSMSTVESGLRIASLALGCAVAVVTLYKFFKKP